MGLQQELARQLLANDALDKVGETLLRRYMTEWAETDEDQSEDRERIYFKCKILDDFMNEINSVAEGLTHPTGDSEI